MVQGPWEFKLRNKMLFIQEQVEKQICVQQGSEAKNYHMAEALPHVYS